MFEKILNYYKEMHGDTPEVLIVSCKEYLKETDYAIIKMYEEVVQGGSIIEMLKEYKEVLAKRKDARALINELEESIK